MNPVDSWYIQILKKIISANCWENNRTGIKTCAIPSACFEHDMQSGFPIIGCKKTFYKSIKVELEGFIKGISSKKWFQERGCTIWDEWANPQKVPYGHDEKTKRKMLEEDDLGIIYGVNWRNFRDPEFHSEKGVDQLAKIVHTLKTNPQDRRMICLSWNPLALSHAALPPCHYVWSVNVINNKLNLYWTQRSTDFFLGAPFNISSYATLLHLLSLETGIPTGTLTGFFQNVHVYENQMDAVDTLLKREIPYFQLPEIQTQNFKSIFEWESSSTQLINYQSLDKIYAPVAV